MPIVAGMSAVAAEKRAPGFGLVAALQARAWRKLLAQGLKTDVPFR